VLGADANLLPHGREINDEKRAPSKKSPLPR
jgi:hypothetical protein